MKKILILTVTAGNGHNACAKGMAKKLKELDPTAEIKIVDILKEYSGKMNVWIADKGYALAMVLLPAIYDKFYNHYKKAPAYKRYKCAGQGYAQSVMAGLLKEIYSFKPDVIYSTHFYGAIALTNLKMCYNIPCKTIVSNLDYVNSPFWEACIGVDYFAIPNEDFVDECIEEGFRKEQLLPFGLPVKEEFMKVVDKKDARKEIGLDEKLFTVMIIFGGGHWGGGFKIFKTLTDIYKDQKIQVIMINGKNKKSFDKIAKMKFENIKVVNVGFTDKVDLYMSASDVIVTKLGGMGATEAINKLRPMIVTKKVYGQERHNLNYLTQKGITYSFKNKQELKDNINKFKDDKKFYDKTVEKISGFRVNGIDNIAKFILSFDKAVYDSKYEKNIDYSQVKKTIKEQLKIENKKTVKEHKKTREKKGK
jgi:processive 1,2-diacylglycerol beta-glucosyltransferase